jgi:hypothetical protein
MSIIKRLFKKSKYNKYLIGAAAILAIGIPSTVVAYSSANKTDDGETIASMVVVEPIDKEAEHSGLSTTYSSAQIESTTTESAYNDKKFELEEKDNGLSCVDVMTNKSISIISEMADSAIDKDSIDSEVKTAKEKLQAIRDEKARLEAEALALAEAQAASEPEPEPVQEQVTYSWSGAVLSPQAGVVQGPSGKETYYNLDMSGVVSLMRQMGYDEANYPYWVRNDGCKMLGNYIMVAADLNLRPRGSVIECSLGTALVCDTGGFAAADPYQLDIAVTW